MTRIFFAGPISARATAWAWGSQAHEIIAIIGADNLSPSARDQVAKILGNAADTSSLEKAMAAASVRPDTEFREKDRSTAPWPFIDICLHDQKSDLPARWPGMTLHETRPVHFSRTDSAATPWCAKSLFYVREFRRFVMVQQYVFTIEEVKEAVRQATETQSRVGLLAKSAHQSSGGHHEGTGSSCGGDCG